MKTINQEGISFTLDSIDYGKIEVKKIEKKVFDEPVPMMAAPEHVCAYLEDTRPLPAFEKGARYFFPARSTICVFPLEDKTVDSYSKSYSEIHTGTGKVLELLLSDINPLEKKCARCLPDLWADMRGAGNILRAKYSKVKFQSGEGILFLTQYSQGMYPSPANNEELTYSFQGVTEDRKFYFTAALAVTHSQLPKGIDVTRDVIGFFDSGEDLSYLEDDAKTLDGFSDESFQPSLKKLQALIATINITSQPTTKKSK